MDRTRIGIGTIINGLMVGTFADLFFQTGISVTSESILLNMCNFIIGTAIMSSGIAIYICADLGGEAGIDSIMILLSKKFDKPVNHIRIVLDILIGMIAWLIGGKIFVGTVLAMFLNGPIIGMAIRYFNNNLKWTIEQKYSVQVNED